MRPSPSSSARECPAGTGTKVLALTAAVLVSTVAVIAAALGLLPLYSAVRGMLAGRAEDDAGPAAFAGPHIVGSELVRPPQDG
jgi:hypothetical protein